MAIYGNNRTLLREGGYLENSPYTPLDCMIESAQTDLAIFEEVIDNDMYHAYCEAGMVYVTEADEEKKDEKTKKGIFTRIKDFFKNIWKAIRGLFGKAKDKLNEASENDQELFKKSGKAVSLNGAGKKIKTKYKKELYERNLSSIIDDKYMDWIDKYLNDIDKAVKSAKTAEEFENAIKDDKAGYEKDNEDYSKQLDEYFKENDKEEEIEFTQDMVDAVCATVASGLDNMLKILETDYNQVDARIKRAQKINETLEHLTSAASTDSDEEKKEKEGEMAIINAQAKALTNVGSIMSKKYKMEYDVLKKLYDIHRSAFSSLASLCGEKKEEKKEGESSQNASATAWAMGQLSEFYIEQALSLD